jgi:GNAT superfamily N-acetyltransferase
MQMVIRELKLEDAAGVNRLSAQLGYSQSIENTSNQIERILSRNDHAAFVATTNNEVLGWIHSFQTLYLESVPFVEIGGLVIDEKHRSKGIGKALINRVKEWCLQQEIHQLRVRTQTKRFDAQRFYAAFGFNEIKEQKVYQLDILTTRQ